MKKSEVAGLINLIKKHHGIADAQLHTGSYHSDPVIQAREDDGKLACERVVSVFIPYSGSLQDAFPVFQRMTDVFGRLGYSCTVIKLHPL